MRSILTLGFVLWISFYSAAQEKKEIDITPSEETAETGLDPLPVGTKINPLLGRDIDGNALPPSKLDDGKVYLLDFWFARCTPCVASIPRLVELQNKFMKQGFEVIGINSFDARTEDQNSPYDQLAQPRYKLKTLVDQLKVNYTLYFSDLSLDTSYHVKAYPTLYLIKNGEVIFSHVGFDEEGLNEVEGAIQLALTKEN